MRSVIPRDAMLIPAQAERVFKGIIFDVYHWQQKMFDGTIRTFERLRRPDTVKVIAIKDDKIVVLLERQPRRTPGYGLPGGRNDVEIEDELACAKRELLEETGMVFETYRLLDAHQRAEKIESFVYIFLATGFVSQEAVRLDGGEEIGIELVDFAECLARSKTPMGKYLPRLVLEKAGSLEGLLTLPEYQA